MLPRIEYLEFASRWYGQVQHDLASSGIAAVGAAELGDPPAPDDFAAREHFRQAVAARYRVPAAEVVPCLGTSGALYAAIAGLCEPGARVLVEQPAYEPLWRVAQGLRAPVDRFERRVDDDFRLSVASVLAQLEPETRVVVVTNPHNPSGVLADDATLRELAEALRERDAWLLVDEAYLELCRPAETARHLGERVITCSSTTKCWGVPWARAGWLLAPAGVATEVARVELYVAGRAPPSSFAWGVRTFERADSLNERARRLQSGKRAHVDNFLAAHADALCWVPPHPASAFGWVRDARGKSLVHHLEQAASARGVLVAPGRFFGDETAFRLSWTGELDQLCTGLAQLARALEL